MKHKLIKIDNYLLVVDDSEIKDYYYDFFVNKLKHSGGDKYAKSDIAKQVIAHLPLNNAPILEGLPLLPPLENEVEKLANKWAIDNSDITMESNSALNKGFKGGYNKAKEKYKYTEEDLRKAMSMYKGAFTKAIVYTQEQIIQSLQQPKMPVAFECEKVTIWTRNADRNVPTLDDFDYVPKTITNSQGQTQLVGTYIYE